MCALSFHQNWLILFVVMQHLYTYPLGFKAALPYICLYWYLFLLYVQHWNCFHTVHKAKLLSIFPEFMNEFDFITAQVAEFPTIFLFLWWSSLWIVCHILFPSFQCFEFSQHMFYFVIMEKLGLNEDKVASCLRGMDGAENLNIMRHLKI